MQPNQVDIWRTGHYINEEVTKSLKKGVPHSMVRHTSLVHAQYKTFPCIAYGILRGTADAFKRADNANLDWWEVDRGFFKPNHFDGYYRFCYKDMQPTYHDLDLPYDRLDKLKLEIKDWQKGGDYILLCPPTDYIENYYKLDNWTQNTIDELEKYTDRPIKIRAKGNDRPLEWDIDGAYCVVVCNSNVANDALLRGKPAIVDKYSVVKGWNNLDFKDIEGNLTDFDRMKLFAYLSYCQFTLNEVESGTAWVVSHEIQRQNATDKNICRLG